MTSTRLVLTVLTIAFALLLSLLSASTVLAGGGGSGGNTPSPKCDYIKVNGSPLAEVPYGGGNVILSWDTSGATSITMSSGYDGSNTTGSISVFVDANTNFALRPYRGDSYGEACEARVVVASPPVTSCDSFTASPTVLPEDGGDVTLAWHTSNADTAAISHGIGSVQDNGAQSVSLTSTQTYTLTTTGSHGSETCEVTVFVAPEEPNAFTLSSLDNLYTVGDTDTLSWSSHNMPDGAHVVIDLYHADGELAGTVVQTPVAEAQYSWTVPQRINNHILTPGLYKFSFTFPDSNTALIWSEEFTIETTPNYADDTITPPPPEDILSTTVTYTRSNSYFKRYIQSLIKRFMIVLQPLIDTGKIFTGPFMKSYEFEVSPTTGTAPLLVTATIEVPNHESIHNGALLADPCWSRTIGTIAWGDGDTDSVAKSPCDVDGKIEIPHTYTAGGEYSASFTKNNGKHIDSHWVLVESGIATYTLTDVTNVTSEYFDPSPEIADEEYTEYVISLTNGTDHIVQVGFMPIEWRDQTFRDTGYTGDIEALMALAQDLTQIACTADALQCSDGSWVSRTGPSCEFSACPNDTNTPELTSIASDDFDDTMSRIFASNWGDHSPYQPSHTDGQDTLIDFGDGSSPEWVQCATEGNFDSSYCSNLITFEHTYALPGNYTVTLYNGGGMCAGECSTTTLDEIEIFIGAISVDTNTLSASPSSGNSPLDVTFEANPQGRVSFGGNRIDFGDGTSATADCTEVLLENGSCTSNTTRSVSHTYTNPGTYSAIFYGIGEGSVERIDIATIEITVSSNVISCPSYELPVCTNGTIVSNGVDTNGCSLGSQCVSNNTIEFEMSVRDQNGVLVQDWSSDSQIGINTDQEIAFKWNSAGYDRCLLYIADNGNYSLTRIYGDPITSGNTYTEEFNVFERVGEYRVQCSKTEDGSQIVQNQSIYVNIATQ